MKVMGFVKRTVKRVLWYVFLPYLIYLACYGCVSNTPPSNAISRYTCPPLEVYVYPAWSAYVQPQIHWVDEKFDVSRTVSVKLEPLKDSWDAYDETYKVTRHLAAVYAETLLKATTLYDSVSYVAMPYLSLCYTHLVMHYEKTVRPLMLYYGAKYKYALETTVDSAFSSVSQSTWLAARYLKSEVRRAYSRFLEPTVLQFAEKACQFSVVRKLVRGTWSVYHLLLEQSSLISSSLQWKKDFVRLEFSNLVQFDRYKRKLILDRDELNTVVSNILQDFSKLETASNEKGVNEKGSPQDNLADDEVSVYSDDEVEYVTVTRTHYVTGTSDSAVPEASVTDTGLAMNEVEANGDDVTTFNSDSSQAQINYELSAWKERVQKALDLAASSIEEDFGPYLNKTIEALKDTVVANFSLVQQENYQRYKEMGELIAAIDKDTAYVKQTNKTIDEPEVDRQLMRDKIAAAYDIPESILKHVEQNLNEAHVEVMTQYHKVAQETVDVLESFAESAVQDFSSRLSGLLDMLQNNDDFDDAMIWAAWKKFHKVKESIFAIRDEIFDEANAYKINSTDNKVPRGLATWSDYLSKVSFHITYLLRDNTEYLQLMRAKANVAYQERERWTYKLEEEAKAAKELKEKEEEKEKAENAKLMLEAERVRLEKVRLREQELAERAKLSEEGAKRAQLESEFSAEVPNPESPSNEKPIHESQHVVQDSGVVSGELRKNDDSVAELERNNKNENPADANEEASKGPKNPQDSNQDSINKQNVGDLPIEAGEKDEFVQEADERLEMTGERRPAHDEL